jgi:hypothetical protein
MSKDEGKYVKARGLPWSASAEEVMEFFAGCEVVGGAEGVHFINNQAALWNRNRKVPKSWNRNRNELRFRNRIRNRNKMKSHKFTQTQYRYKTVYI